VFQFGKNRDLMIYDQTYVERNQAFWGITAMNAAEKTSLYREAVGPP